MGCFLRHDFEKELKSRSQQHESNRKTCGQGSAIADSQRCGKVQGALACRARRIQLKEPERLVRLQ